MATIQNNIRWADNTAELKKNLQDGVNTLDAMKQAVDRTVNSMSGNGLFGTANKVTAAVQQMGGELGIAAGAAKLTGAEQERVNAILDKAIEKYKAMGIEAPAALRELQAATQKSSDTWGKFQTDFKPKEAIESPISSATSALKLFAAELGPIGGIAIGVVGALTAVGAVALKLAEDAAAVGANLNDMGERSGIAVPKLSRLSQAAQVAGTDINTLSGTIQKMDAAAADSPDKFAKGLEKIGLNFQEFIALAPEDRLMAVSTGLAATTDSAVRNAAGMELMGKQFREIEPALLKLNEAMAITSGISVWTDQQAKDAEQFEMQMKAMSLQLSDLGVRIGRDLIPPALALLQWFRDVEPYAAGAVKWASAGGLVFQALSSAAGYTSAALDLLRGSLNKLPDPFGDAAKKAKELKDQLFDASRTPDIELAKLLAPIKGLTLSTADLDLAWKEETRSNADAVAELKKAVTAAEAWQKVIDNVNSSGEGWRGTLDTIDGSIVAWSKHLLDAGVSAQAVAKYYGLTDAQVKALQKSLEDDKAFLKLKENVQKIEFGVNGLGEAIEKVGIKSKDPAFAAEFEKNYQAAKHVEDGVFGIGTALDKLGTKVDTGVHHLTTMTDIVGMLAGSFTLLGRNSDGAFGSMIGEIGQVLGLLGQTDRLIKNLGPGKNGQPLAGSNWGIGGVMFDKNATGAQRAQAGIAAGVDVIQGAEGIWDATGSHASAAGNAGAGALAGAKAGAAFGPYGMAIGAAAGLIVGIIRGKPEWAKAAEDVGRDFGFQAGKGISDGLAKEIAGLEESEHTSRLGAELIDLNKIIGEAGGLTSKNLGQMTSRLHDVFSMIETHQLTIEQGTKIIDENWQAFVEAGTDGDGRLSASLKEIIQLNEKFGTQSKEIAAYLQQQAQSAGDGFNAIVAGTEDAIKGYDDLKAAVDAASKQSAAKIDTSAYSAAIAQMSKAERDALKAGADALGISQAAFLSQQAVLYGTAKEGDDRLKTWLSGQTLALLKVSQGGDVFTKAISQMGAAEKNALLAGMAGFKGTTEEFLAQQAALYTYAQEGDSRLKTWLSGETLATINSTQAGHDLVAALAAQQQAAEAAKQELSDLGVQAVASYAAMVASGMTAADALAKISPSLTKLQQSYEDLGLSVDDVALKNLLMQNKITQGNPALMSAIGGLNQEMIALDNMGLMNADTFGAMERTGMQMYTRLQAQVAAVGGTTKDALLPMQDYLHKAADEAALLGIPLDANTQMLIEQSKDVGIWKDKTKSATDILTSSMQTLVDKVNDLIDALNGIPKKVNTDVTVTTTQKNGVPPPDGSGGPTSGAPSGPPPIDNPYGSTGGYVTTRGIANYFGMGGMVGSLVPSGSDTVPAMLTPNEGVLNVDAMARIGGAEGLAALNHGGGPVSSTHKSWGIVVVNGRGKSDDEIHAEVMRKLPPAVLNNEGGIGSDLKRALGMSITTWT